MSEYEPAEALAEIERTQQKAYARQGLPLWYAPGYIGVLTLWRIGEDGTGRVVGVLSSLGAAVGFALLVALLVRQVRVRWTLATWTRSAAMVALGWVALLLLTALGVYVLAAAVDEPLRKLLTGGAAMLVATVTTRPMERLVLRHSQGKVVG